MTSSKVPFCIDFIKVSMREMASTARCEDAFFPLVFRRNRHVFVA